MVVGIHTLAYVPLEGIERTITGFIVHPIAVAIFFTVDGILLARDREQGRYFRYGAYLFRSGKRLLIPWFLFSLLYVVLRGILEYAGVFSENLVKGGSVWDLAVLVYSSKVASQMYFLLSLFFIRTFSFAWQRMAVLPVWILIGIWAVYTVITSAVGSKLVLFFPEGLDPVYHAIMGLRFYLLGMVLYVCRRSIEKYGGPIIIVSLLATACFKSLSATTILIQVPYLVCVYVIFLKYFNRESIVSRTGLYTMGIYVIHAPIIVKALSLLADTLTNGGLVAYVSVLCLGFLLSLGLTRAVRSVKIGRFLLGEAG